MSKWNNKITLPLEAYLAMAPDAKEGVLHMTMGDTSADIKKGEEKVGEVIGAVGGGVQVSLYTEQRVVQYFINAKEIWNSFCKSVNHKHLQL